MTQENLKDGASCNLNSKAASISTNFDTISTNMNNINISKSKDNVSKCDESGKEAEITSEEKVRISCAQNLDCKTGTRDASVASDINAADKNLISDDELFKDLPPKDDCPICMQPMPYENGVCGVDRIYQPCCGKMLCCGCLITSMHGMKKGKLKPWCAFCRVPLSNSDQEKIKRCKKRMKLNEGDAFYHLGMKYFYGSWGLQKDKIKATELWNQAAELGVCRAHYNLALSYWNGDGVEKDTSKALHHYRLAAIGGHESARHMLGCLENDMGNLNRSRDNMCRAMKHYMIAAGSGFDESLKAVGEGYKTGWVTKGEYASTLRAYQESLDEMKSEQRTEAMKHKKS